MEDTMGSGLRPGGRLSLGSLIDSIRQQAVRYRWIWLLCAVVFAIVFGALIVIRATTGVAIAEFTRDPLGFTGLPVYKGAVSNLGVLVWMSGSAIALFTYGLLRAHPAARTPSTFLLAIGLITLALVLDDLYMLHEVVFPDNVGIPENAVYASYILAVAWLLVWYWREILSSAFLFLLLGLAGMATSVLADFFAGYVNIPGYYVIEDGGKFFGILNWTAYIMMTSARAIFSHFARSDGLELEVGQEPEVRVAADSRPVTMRGR